jgi:hypothetical protein
MREGCFLKWLVPIGLLLLTTGCGPDINSIRTSFCVQLAVKECDANLFKSDVNGKLLELIKSSIEKDPITTEAVSYLKAASQNLAIPSDFDAEDFVSDYKVDNRFSFSGSIMDGQVFAKGLLIFPSSVTLCRFSENKKEKIRCEEEELSFLGITLRVDPSTPAGKGLISYYKECKDKRKLCFVDFAGYVRAVRKDAYDKFGWASVVWFAPHVPTRDDLIANASHYISREIIGEMNRRPLMIDDKFNWAEFISDLTKKYISLRVIHKNN